MGLAVDVPADLGVFPQSLLAELALGKGLLNALLRTVAPGLVLDVFAADSLSADGTFRERLPVTAVAAIGLPADGEIASLDRLAALETAQAGCQARIRGNEHGKQQQGEDRGSGSAFVVHVFIP